jgi:uncharacterized membrane protein YozB (DUF420 family)
MSRRPHRSQATRAQARVAPVPPLYRFGLQFFAVFSLAMLVAFWPSYFSRLDSQPSIHPHAHGLTMTLWVALLISQAWLIRSSKRSTHRTLGVLSYVLVPALVLAALAFLHFRLRPVSVLDDSALYFTALVVNALVAFLLLYGLAMWFRREPAVHARFMIATLFPLFTPVTDRLIGRYVPAIVPLVPRIGGSPVLPTAGFLLADVLLVALSVWDWRTNKRRVFPVALVVLVLYHASVLTFHQFDFWRRFAAWFVALPLS